MFPHARGEQLERQESPKPLPSTEILTRLKKLNLQRLPKSPPNLLVLRKKTPQCVDFYVRVASHQSKVKGRRKEKTSWTRFLMQM